MFSAIRKGDEYRLKKYGNTNGWVPLNYEKWKQLKEDRTAKTCIKTPQQKDVYKASFEFWDEWTGGRYKRIRNPFIKMRNVEFKDKYGINKPEVVLGSICRSNPVTGEWSPR